MKNMKAILLSMLLCLASYSALYGDQSCSDGSFSCSKSSCSDDSDNISRLGFLTRPLSTDSTLELALFNYHIYHNFVNLCERPAVNLQVSYFHRESRRKHDGRGFFPNGTNAITIAEDGSGDINSLNLGLGSPAGFNSTVCIFPKFRINGAYIGARFNFDNCGVWASLSFAVARHDNSIRIDEVVTNPGTVGGLTNAVDALNAITNNALSRCDRGRTFVDDIQLKLGYDWFYCCNANHTGLYLVGTIPTRRRHSDACDNIGFFDSRLAGRHGSIGVGLNQDWTLWNCDIYSFNFMADVKYRYVFPASEERVLDLNCGPLSRFSQVVVTGQPLDLKPALPFLTQNVRVSPRSTVDFWAAFHYQACNFGAEFGYDLYWKQREKVCLRDKFCDNISLFNLCGVPGCNRTSTPDSNLFTPLSTKDLNIKSAIHDSVLSHKVYAALSYDGCICCVPALVGVGAEYEFSTRCQPTFDHWGIFVKAIVNF